MISLFLFNLYWTLVTYLLLLTINNTINIKLNILFPRLPWSYVFNFLTNYHSKKIKYGWQVQTKLTYLNVTANENIGTIKTTKTTIDKHIPDVELVHRTTWMKLYEIRRYCMIAKETNIHQLRINDVDVYLPHWHS